MTKITSMDGSISIETFENGSVELWTNQPRTVIEGKELKALVNRALECDKHDNSGREEGCYNCVNYGSKCCDCFMDSEYEEYKE